MQIALVILLKLAGLYAAIGMGWVSARHLGLQNEGISKLLFYLIVPLVFVHGISHMEMHGVILFLPFLTFGIACFLALGMYYGPARRWDDSTRNILAFTSGNGNIGYFGLPIAVLLFNTQTVAIYMVLIIGLMIYESTLGYYLLTRGRYTGRAALRKMLSQPVLHASVLGLLLSFLHLPTPAFLDDFFLAVRGTYTILGMMLVGMGLAAMPHFKLDWPFMALSFGVKFIAWPLMMAAFIALDNNALHWFEPETHHAMLLFSFVPLAVNSVILATLFDAKPEKIAAAVFASTGFALLYVPVMVALFIH